MGRTIELATGSPEETKAVGAAVGSLLGSGDVVSLTGDLGAGKTTFVQGAAEALLVKDPVLSPTFTLIREYQGTFRVYHLDVYRLDRLQDVLDLGIDEIFDQGAVSFVEWGEVIDSLLPDAYLSVEVQLVDGDWPGGEAERRLLSLSATGGAWASRWPTLEHSTESWRVEPSEEAGGQR